MDGRAAAPIVTFLSDYGLEDEFVGVCHAVIAAHCPEARVIDLGHGVPRGDVRQAAVRLADAIAGIPEAFGGPASPATPAAVHLAVVDPGVGGPRRPVAIRCRAGGPGHPEGDRGDLDLEPAPAVARQEFLLVGPDNGLLWPAVRAHRGAFDKAAGVKTVNPVEATEALEAVDAVDLTATPVRREPVSATFHGRDIFAPVAAHLARGAPLEALGEPIAADSLVRLELPRATRDAEEWLRTEVLAVDRFGNASLAARPSDLQAPQASDDSVADAASGAAADDAPDARVDADADAGATDATDAAAGAAAEARAATVIVRLSGGERSIALVRTFSDVAQGELALITDSSGRLAVVANGASAAETLDLSPGDTVLVDLGEPKTAR